MDLKQENFTRPYFQLAQIKQHCPENLDLWKGEHKANWEIWKALALDLAQRLQLPKPYVESWTNGWQLRAHFFATLKSAAAQDSAAIISLLLNRRRLTLSLEWHEYRAKGSRTSLAQFNRWLGALADYGDWELWPGDADEYADYKTVAEQPKPTAGPGQFYCLGRHLYWEELAKMPRPQLLEWLAAGTERLWPLYELAVAD